MTACTACTSRNAHAIDAAIEAGETMSAIGRRFGLSRFVITRHRDAHLFDARVAATLDAREPATPPTIDSRLVQIEEALVRSLEAAQRNGRLQGVVAASRELRATLEVLHRVRVEERAEREAVELTFVEEMRAVRQALVETIGPRHPEYLEEFERRLEVVRTADLDRKVREASGDVKSATWFADVYD